MKKIMFFLCFALLLTGRDALASPAGRPELKTASTGGTIVSVSEGRVTVAGKGFVDEITLLAVEGGYILDGATGRPLDFSALKPGIEVTVYYSPLTARSLPPQAKAIAVVVGGGPETALYFKAGQVEKLPNGVRILNDNRDQYITITNDVLFYPQQITVGGEFLAWYPVSTLSMPGQATALRALPLRRVRPDIAVSLKEGSILAGGRKLTLGQPKVENNVLFLPLRSICESLGYTVYWEKEKKSAVLRKGDVLAFVAADDNSCGPPLSPIKLDVPPRLFAGALYVPVEFFAQALGHAVQVSKE
jgi:hypothetical protein